MKERSGRPSVKGVGTVTMATSKPAHERLSVDAWYLPVSTADCRSPQLMSSMNDSPALSFFVRCSSVS